MTLDLQVRSHLKQPDFIAKKPDFIAKQPDFIVKQFDFIVKQPDFIAKQAGSSCSCINHELFFMTRIKTVLLELLLWFYSG